MNDGKDKIVSEDDLEKISGGDFGDAPENEYKRNEYVYWNSCWDLGMGVIKSYEWNGITWMYKVGFGDYFNIIYDIQQCELTVVR